MKKWKNDPSQIKSNKLKARDVSNRKTLGEYKGYIFRQDSERIKELMYGRFFKVGKNGCGAVAAYNVMLALGKPVDFCDVLLEFELNHIGRLDGLLGTSPKRLPRYFKAHGVDCDIIDRFSEYKQRMNDYKISIIFIREKNTLIQHYYCVLKRGEVDFVTINQTFLNSFGKLNWDDHFIKAYCFI